MKTMRRMGFVMLGFLLFSVRAFGGMESYNTFYGLETGLYNMGSSNTFIGLAAGFSNTGGSSNTFLGDMAGQMNTTGHDNTFAGSQAGINNTTGAFNVFIGNESGLNNTTGSFNTFNGHQAGFLNVSGAYNTFIGYQNGYSNCNGGSNTFIGYQAGYNNKAGNSTLIGYQAGYSNTTGAENVFLGQWAGYSTAAGGTNTFLGTSAGYHNTTGAGNVFLGYNAGAYANGSNKLYIANSATVFPLIYGEFDTPKITINGTLGMSSGAFVTVGGVWTNASSREYKEHIQSLDAGEALAALKGLNPVTFVYKADKNEKHVGFIAEEVPELLAARDRKGLSSMDIVAVLAKALQQQQERMRDQQRLNLEQQKINQALLRRIHELETRLEWEGRFADASR